MPLRGATKEWVDGGGGEGEEGQEGLGEMMIRRNRRLLILCSDNRYRSPLAHAIMGQYHRLDCVSAGFDDAVVGFLPPDLIVEAGEQLGLSLHDYHAIPLEPCLLDWADDFILLDAFTRASLKAYREELGYPDLPRTKLHMLGEYATPKSYSIIDPTDFHPTYDEFQQMIDQIVLGSHRLAKILTNPFSGKN